MKQSLSNRVAKLTRRAAVRETGVMCRWIFHQPKAPQALLQTKQK